MIRADMMIAKSKKGPAASANDELEIFTSV